jgi:hypothetical protein
MKLEAPEVKLLWLLHERGPCSSPDEPVLIVLRELTLMGLVEVPSEEAAALADLGRGAGRDWGEPLVTTR